MVSLDAFGHLSQETRGPIITTRSYTSRGELDILTSRVGATTLMNLDLDYDLAGTIKRRADSVTPRVETYGYDALDRLKRATVVGGTGYRMALSYDAAGNISYKDGLYYAYTDSAHPHAVTRLLANAPYPSGLLTKVLGSLAGEPSRYNATIVIFQMVMRYC